MRLPYFPLVRSMLLTVLLSGFPSFAMGTPPSPVAAVNTTDGVALKGYDPVAYFVSGQPTPGVEPHTYDWKGVTYRFASNDNLELFKADPEKYLPQYGGYCAYAMSINRIADIDPDRWAIIEGKLYLNNNFFAHTLWSVNKSGNIVSGNKHWAVWPKTDVDQ
jgi:YHS domain-containing protein